MCGIAGIVDLSNRRPVPAGIIQAMAEAISHRGPDEDGFLEQPGLSLASRRLSIVGLQDGRQPISNEDGKVTVVFNGELFDYPEKRADLQARGHRFKTHCDTELIPHLWEDNQERMFDHLRGQFAFALWDQGRHQLVLARDRFGICPLYWTRQGDWLLFASEIKALLASGLVPARPDPRGLNHLFTFFALPGPVTCFQGIQLLTPGHYLRVNFGWPGEPAKMSEHTYWEIDFPDLGEEDRGTNAQRLIDDFEAVMLRAVEKRLRADVPVVSYLSGGVDSSLIVALASHVRKQPIPTFTIQVKSPRFDELSEAELVARHVGTQQIVIACGADEVLKNYPRVILAAEGPVIDTSCAATIMLAQAVHAHGYKVALCGEGSDEWLAGYPWYKVYKLFGLLNFMPGLEQLVRRSYLRLKGGSQPPLAFRKRLEDATAGSSAWHDMQGMASMSKYRLFSPAMRELALEHVTYDDLGLNLDRARRWHPLNRALYIGARTMLPGLLLNAKGDRSAMNSSVETRYPFLDEEVFSFLARLHPRWKMPGFRDKYILRRLAQRWLPRRIAWRTKAMFRAPLDSFHLDRVPPFVDQLLSRESLRKSGHFDPDAVIHWRTAFLGLRARSYERTSMEMGLVGVVSTQLWHHTFIDSSLADLPSLASAARPGPAFKEKRKVLETTSNYA